MNDIRSKISEMRIILNDDLVNLVQIAYRHGEITTAQAAKILQTDIVSARVILETEKDHETN